MLVNYLEDLLKNISICYLYSEEKEDFYFLKNVVQEIAFGHIDHKMTQEIVVYFCCYFLIDALIDVVVLIRRLALALLEVLVEFTAIFEQQMEDLSDRVVDHTNLLVSFRDVLSFVCLWTYKHAFQDVDHLYLQLRVRDFLVNGEENVKYVGLILHMIEIVKL